MFTTKSKCVVNQFHNFDFIKDKVEKQHSFSMLPKTITIATFINAKYSKSWWCKKVLNVILNYSLVIGLHGNGGSNRSSMVVFHNNFEKKNWNIKSPFIKKSKDLHPLIFWANELFKAKFNL